MRITLILFLIAFSGSYSVSFAIVDCPDLCTDPEDVICVTELLDAFEPFIEFVDEGPGPEYSRTEYPIYFDDDLYVENNREDLPGVLSPKVLYRQAVRLIDVDLTEYWLLEYHYYYPANWHIDVSITGNGYTHEHDWEWIYIIVGWNEVLNCHVGFAAVLSAHSAHNRDAMMNQSRTYLFPRVVLRDLMEYPYLSHSRVLSDDWISDETDISTMLTRAGVKVHPMGNEMSELATAPSDHGFEVVDVVPRGWELGEGCGEGDETYMCFGDPQNCDVTIFDICHSESECEDEKYVPWARDGLGENSPVPYYFNVPETIAIEGEYDVEIGNVEFSVIGQPGELLVSWNWFHSRPKPESFVLITRSEDGSGYCRIGEIVENGSVKYNCIISDCTDQRELITDNWRICSSCLTEGNTAGNSIELWVKWPSGRVNKLAMSEPILDDTIEISPKLGIKGNPVHNFCNISYFLPKRNQLSLSVYDIHGRRIRELYAGTSEPGWHSSTWNINNGEDSSLASGVFWVCLEWSGGMVTKQVTVLK